MSGQVSFSGQNPASAPHKAAGSRVDGVKPAAAWDFYPAREKWAERLWTGLGLGGFVAAAGLLLGPLALGGMAVYGGAALAYALRGATVRQRNAYVAGGIWHRVDNGKYARALHDMARAFGLPDDVNLYVADRQYAEKAAFAKSSLPLYFMLRGLVVLGRRIFRIPPRVNDRYGEDRPFSLCGSFQAHGLSRSVLTSVGEIRRFRPAAVRLIIAHELAHLKTKDGRKCGNYAHFLVREMRPLLLGMFFLSPLWGAAALSGPVAVATGIAGPLAIAAVLGASSLALGCFRTASRICERRADRNAVFMTRDAAAIEQMDYGMMRVPPLMTYMSTHPLGRDRTENLRAAFAQAASYAPPAHNYVARDTPSKFARGRKPGVTAWGVGMNADMA